jgi:hypothetical protein
MKRFLFVAVIVVGAASALAQQPQASDPSQTSALPTAPDTDRVLRANQLADAAKALQALQAREPFAGTSKPATPDAPTQMSKKVRGYSLVLLLGDTMPGPMPEGLSAPARKALADIKDFLPYKSFRILDTQWLAGANSGASSSGRLRGPDDLPLGFQLATSQLNQKFQLWSADGHTILLDNSFTMRVGETVVVGTSRVQGGDKALGDKALVVLFSIVEATP